MGGDYRHVARQISSIVHSPRPRLWSSLGWRSVRSNCANPTSPHEVLSYAVAVAEKHGLGKRHLSNFDCFHYAHAMAANVPLLTLDQLLCVTDVETLPA